MRHDNSCPPADLIAEFASGQLSPERISSIQEHVSQCDECLATVGILAARSSQSQGPPALADGTFAEIGLVIGPYQLLRRVGEGGMGEVWEAQQSTPVRRRVALKLLKSGMDTRQILARFEIERQLLARMQHPHIAQVFDAGITSAGRPYFVMEFVEGARITTYCDDAGLDVDERLFLFQQVCDAVQHAHQKGVIHRDLKPSNVLVTRADHPMPKVIDFGLAKATTSDDADHSLTEIGTILGTPSYASPEQLGLGAKDVDTRTDVYSLGVLLYELLIGVIPFELDAARPASMLDLRHSIRENEPTRPSARLSMLGAKANDIALARNTDPTALRKQLRGDLDWIVMKALEKDRERRYASAHELALDVQRYLQHEPLIAGPPTTTYRLRKFIRRHRVGTAFAATLLVLISGFVVTTIVQAQRIAQERDRATAEAAKAQSINAFLQETLGSADPWQTGRDISIREVLGNAVTKATQEFRNQPLIAAGVTRSIGNTYLRLGRYDEAEPLLRSAFDVRLRELGREHDDVAESLEDLARIASVRSDFVAAENHAREAVTLYRKLHGNDHRLVAQALDQLAVYSRTRGEFSAAEAACVEALAIRERLFGPRSAEAADSLLALAAVVSEGSGQLTRALETAQQGYEIRRSISGSDDLRTASAANVVGAMHWRLEQYEDALTMYREALRIHEAQLGQDHAETAMVKENLANTLGKMRRFDESIPLLEEVLAVRQAKAGPDAAVSARTMDNIAGHEADAGRLDRAAMWYDRALPIYRRTYGDKHPVYAASLRALAGMLHKQNDDVRAETMLREALKIHLDALGPDHPQSARTKASLGRLLIDRKAFEEAESLLTSAYGVRIKTFGIDHVQTQQSIAALQELYAAWGKPEKAAQFVPTSAAR